jgi:hypothetical protein
MNVMVGPNFQFQQSLLDFIKYVQIEDYEPAVCRHTDTHLSEIRLSPSDGDDGDGDDEILQTIEGEVLRTQPF